MGDPIACDCGGSLAEIRRKMCHVAKRQKRLIFGRILSQFKERKEKIIRSVTIKQKVGKCIKPRGGQDSIQNYNGKLMGRKCRG
jgi:hypothetical protein